MKPLSSTCRILALLLTAYCTRSAHAGSPLPAPPFNPGMPAATGQPLMPGQVAVPGGNVTSPFNRGPLGRIGAMPGSPGIAPSECVMTLGNAKIDFGRYNSGAAPNAAPGAQVQIGTRATSLQITCPQPGYVAITLHGQTRPDGTRYAFGQAGDVTVTARSAQADGRTIRVALVDTPGQVPQTWQDEVRWLPGKTLVLGEPNIAPFSQASIQLTVDANLDSSNAHPTGALSLANSLQFSLFRWEK
ncbi:hypothetical protein [Burkholderia pseudomultivorans]|uniref:hypothetical protein n=1 Tax=Burkholderia pseudomultivorans TaxID=1207504 RepID=UPI000A464926|nr:hypothetical protein [Burkholderia pseudomultivorans]